MKSRIFAMLVAAIGAGVCAGGCEGVIDEPVETAKFNSPRDGGVNFGDDGGASVGSGGNGGGEGSDGGAGGSGGGTMSECEVDVDCIPLDSQCMIGTCVGGTCEFVTNSGTCSAPVDGNKGVCVDGVCSWPCNDDNYCTEDREINGTCEHVVWSCGGKADGTICPFPLSPTTYRLGTCQAGICCSEWLCEQNPLCKPW